ncbi:MAG: hypothetical protein ACRD0M_01285, partial [Acidimicrobiales bacterium]
MTSPARAPRAAEPAVPAGPPPENESRWWWTAAAAIVLGCVALLVNLVATVRDQPGAGGPAPTADGAVGQAPVTIPATVAPTTTEHPGDAAVAAYHASWAAYVAAAQIPDPNHPALAET